jgi:hypothetical protein
MSRIQAVLVSLALTAAPLVALAADSPSLEQVLIDSASTPQQHAALAHYYEDKAGEARKQAEHHRAMGKAYGGGKMSQMAAMKDHCDKLAKLSDDEAKAFDEMARAHKDMAK